LNLEMMLWRGGGFEFVIEQSGLIMGVVNVTPDSFSDGGRFLDARAAVEHGKRLVAEGADIIDIGGESSRPGAESISEGEELRRVMPVIEGLAGEIDVPISVDTTKEGVARRALEAGAAIINDIAGNRKDETMWRTVAEKDAGYVLMHMKGSPQTMQQEAAYSNVVDEVNEFFGDRLNRMQGEGVRPEQVALDVGLGFAKTAEHNLQLLAALSTLTTWGRPLLVGASRKSFIGKVTEVEDIAARLPGSLACACWAAMNGCAIIRTHDVAPTRRALRMIEAIAHQQRNA
jgi:dihydropteroate synthase